MAQSSDGARPSAAIHPKIMAQSSDGARPSAAKVAALQKPEKLQTLMKQDKQSDCLSCKLVGSAAFFGLAAYSYFSGLHHLEKNRAAILKSGSRFGMQARRTGLAGTALALAGIGLYRLVN